MALSRSRPISVGVVPVGSRGGRHEAITQLLRLGARRHAQLPTQDAIEALELADRRVTVAGVGVLAHQRDVRGFVGGVEVDDVAPPAGEPQEVEVAQAQLLAPLLAHPSYRSSGTSSPP